MNMTEPKFKLNRLLPGEFDILPWTWKDGRTFVRFGVHADGSCFFHSLLAATDEEYRESNKRTKSRMGHDFRKKLAKELTVEDFMTLRVGTGYVYEDSAFHEYLEDHTPDIDDLYQAFRAYLRHPKEHVGAEVLELVSKWLNVDIYIIRDGDLAPSLIPSETCYIGRKSILLLHLGDHYEPIGMLRKEKPNFVFSAKRSFIRRFRDRQHRAWDEFLRITHPTATNTHNPDATSDSSDEEKGK